MADVKMPKKVDNRYTIKSLGLDLESAIAGKTWLLLPNGFRESPGGSNYPLPSRKSELQKLAAIYVPAWFAKKDCGCVYIRRATAKWKKAQQRTQSAILDLGERRTRVINQQKEFGRSMKGARAKVREEVERVREEATKAVASLHDLFSLGREGLDNQMKAHIANEELHGEKIDARAFRECFRIVTQAVKGLGLPSDQKEKATDAIEEQVAEALRATRETVAMADNQNDGTEN